MVVESKAVTVYELVSEYNRLAAHCTLCEVASASEVVTNILDRKGVDWRYSHDDSDHSIIIEE